MNGENDQDCDQPRDRRRDKAISIYLSLGDEGLGQLE